MESQSGDGGGSSGHSKGKKKAADADADEEDLIILAGTALASEDFSTAEMFAGRALKSKHPLSTVDETRADQILAIARVHNIVMSTRHRHRIHDWYAILQLGDHSHNIFTPDSLSFNYRHLARLLDPKRNRFAYAPKASKLVSEAYSVLSDANKKSLYDADMRALMRSLSPDFWTICRSCFRVHQYVRGHEGKELRCQTCQKVFVAVELPVDPPIVEGMAMYYCTWGFFPHGFSSGYRFMQQPAAPEAKAPPPSRPPKRPKQTARKTVRTLNFTSGKGIDG